MHARDCVRGIGPIGGRPVDFISPHRSAARRGGWVPAGVERSTIFFWLFAPFFRGVRISRCGFFAQLSLLARGAPPPRPPAALSLSAMRFTSFSLSLSLPPTITRYIYRNVPVSLTASFHTSFLSFVLSSSLAASTPSPTPLSLFFLALAFVFCQPPFAALRVRFV